MSHLTLWEQKGLTYRDYADRQARVLERAYALARSGVSVSEAVARAIEEADA